MEYAYDRDWKVEWVRPVSREPGCRKVIYIAGRYRDGRGAFYVDANIREARREAVFVWVNGGVALCPHLNSAFFDGAFGLGDEVWLEGDLELLRRCDAVYAISNYLASKGAMKEVEYARSLGMRVLFNHAEVLEYLGKLTTDEH